MLRLAAALVTILLLAAVAAASASAAERSPAIAVVVGSGGAKTLQIADLALIYRRKQLFWKDGHRINPVNLPASNPLRRVFSELVLDASPDDLERYWNDMYFHGISPPYVLASNEAVLRFVAQTPGAIGYVDYCAVGERATVLMVLTSAGPISEARARADCTPTP